MVSQDCLHLNVGTNIEIKDANSGKLLCKTKNTLTSKGRAQLGELLMSTVNIDSLILSETTNSGTTQLMFSDAIYLDILNYYISINSSSGAITINIESTGTATEIGNITLASIGLAIGDVLFSVASAGSIVLDNTAVSVLYQIKLEITQE